MTFYVDRFEGDLALVQREDGVPGVILRGSLPPSAREGSVLIYENGAYRLDPVREAARKRSLHERLMSLLRK